MTLTRPYGLSWSPDGCSQGTLAWISWICYRWLVGFNVWYMFTHVQYNVPKMFTRYSKSFLDTCCKSTWRNSIMLYWVLRMATVSRRCRWPRMNPVSMHWKLRNSIYNMPVLFCPAFESRFPVFWAKAESRSFPSTVHPYSSVTLCIFQNNAQQRDNGKWDLIPHSLLFAVRCIRFWTRVFTWRQIRGCRNLATGNSLTTYILECTDSTLACPLCLDFSA